MSIPLPLFQPIDLPLDINLVLNDQNYYIFSKEHENDKIFFTIELLSQTNQLTCLKVDNNFKKTSVVLFEDINYSGNNVNDYLWRLSNTGYNNRFFKLEIIERLRHCTEYSQLQKLLLFLRDIPVDNYTEEI